MEDSIRRAVLLHVVAVQHAIRLCHYDHDCELGHYSTLDWARRVMAWRMFINQ